MEKSEVLDIIKRQSEVNFDEISSSSKLYAETTYNTETEMFSPAIYFRSFKSDFSNSDVEKLNYTDPAFTQLLNRHKVPTIFYDRCTPSLKEFIFDEHVSKKDHQLLLRFTGKGQVRAVLSDKYGIIDNQEVFPTVMDALEETAVINSFTQDDYLSRMIVTFPDATSHFMGVTHEAGLLVTNSETGHSSVWIEPAVFVASNVFVNRAAIKKQDVDCRIVHRGEVDQQRLKDMITNMKRIAQVGVVQVCENWTERVDAAKALDFVRNIDSFPKRMYDILEAEWKDQEDMCKAQVAQRVLDSVQHLPIFQRSRTEQAVGPFLGLFKGFESRINALLEAMED